MLGAPKPFTVLPMMSTIILFALPLPSLSAKRPMIIRTGLVAAHPRSHPLYHLVRSATTKRVVKHHRSSLHHACRAFELNPSASDVETIVHSRRCGGPPGPEPPSGATSTTPYQIRIAPDRRTAIAEHDACNDEIKVYCDGSGQNEKVGAAAVLYRGDKRPRVLRYHLGTEKEHTVREAEAVGLTLAARLIGTEPNVTFPISIYVDNQGAIKSSEVFTTKPEYCMTDRFRKMMMEIQTDNAQKGCNVTVCWISGHNGVEGNERADREAKKAAEGEEQNSAKKRLPRHL